MLRLLRERVRTPEELVSKGVLSEGAVKLIGSEVIGFLTGKTKLSLDGLRVRIQRD